MEMKQKTELRRLLLPALQQSLKILPLSLPELKKLVENELLNNPFLEDASPSPLTSYQNTQVGKNLDFLTNLVTKKMSLKDSLLRELGMFADTERELKIGEEIIGNLDENGYLRANLEEIANTLNVTVEQVEKILKLIQQFEPAGVAARSVSECLILQLDSAGENDPLIRKIVENHLEDVAKKNYSRIAKSLKEPLEKIEPLIKKILKLDPKPGRNYSTQDIQRIIPDIIIDEKDEDLQITINNEDIPPLNINKAYKDILKNNEVDPKTKEFLTAKLREALELLRAISKRQTTLRRIVEIIVETQQDAIRENLSLLKPLTFSDVAQRLNMHESTVCRAIRNKYIKLPCGTVALKALFSSAVAGEDGQSISSNYVKKLIKELIEQEDKKRPLSDQTICNMLSKGKNLNIKRRTVAKYREELKLLSSTFRKER